ncbi:hypothetical protein [Paenibacillus alvei]|uniref:hypothetical protein n=1 Tax=Paenibacillus alvei TaxID=44250 RepID=UPI00227E44B1|nr:hypothetical protein [Paenibacillus alvei]MCY7484331.1 hypothetical protein [Paenibacillus alvei]
MTEDLNKRNKREWIEGAPIFKAERFEIAGALFDYSEDAMLTQEEVNLKLDVYLRPASVVPVAAPESAAAEKKTKRTKEETVNVDSKD